MRMNRFALLTTCAMMMLVSTVRSQDLSERLSKLAAKNATNYIAPIIAGWGADLNSGFYHTADLHDILGFDIQLKLTGARLLDDDRSFMFEMPDEIRYNVLTLRANQDYPKEVRANTAVGPKDETVIRTYPTSVVPNQEIFRVPGGFDVPVSPLIVPQVAVGLPFGLEVMARFIPTTTISAGDENIGKVNFLGVGVRHDIDQYIPAFPFDLAVHFMTQKFNFKDSQDKNLIEANAIAYGVEASAKLLFLTVYGGFQLEKSKFTIGPYDATLRYGTETQNIRVPDFTIEGKNTSRFHAGVRLLLLIVNIHADYSFATTPVITLGAGISFR